MSSHNIGLYEGMAKIIFRSSANTYLLFCMWSTTLNSPSHDGTHCCLHVTGNAASKLMPMFEEVAEMVKGKATFGYIDCR